MGYLLLAILAALAILLGIAYLMVTAAAPEGALFTDPAGVPTIAIPV